MVLKELWLDVGEEKVWLTGKGDELVLGLLGRGGNESVSTAFSSNGSGGEQKEKDLIQEGCFLGFFFSFCLVVLGHCKTAVVVTAGCVSG